MPGPSKSKVPAAKEAVDLEPDAWERFERAIDTVTKRSPKPKAPKSDKREGSSDASS